MIVVHARCRQCNREYGREELAKTIAEATRDLRGAQLIAMMLQSPGGLAGSIAGNFVSQHAPKHEGHVLEIWTTEEPDP